MSSNQVVPEVGQEVGFRSRLGFMRRGRVVQVVGGSCLVQGPGVSLWVFVSELEEV